MGRRAITYWVLQVVGWTVQAALNLIFIAMYWPAMVWHGVLVFGCAGATGILLSHWLRGFLKRRHWLELPIAHSVGRLLGTVVVLGLIQSLLTGIWYWLWLIPTTFQNFQWLPGALAIWSATFLCWVAIYASVYNVRRAQAAELLRLETELAAKDAELRAVLAQVNPHFLFNSLNSLRALTYEDPERAARMVDELANLLRYALQSGKQKDASLRDEIDYVDSYLKLEKIRFEERLRYELRVAEEAMESRLPPMVLQTLVENAVKHGIECAAAGGVIVVTAVRESAMLTVSIESPGSLARKRTKRSTGIGIENARRRLHLMFGQRASLALNEREGVVTAVLRIPQEVGDASADRGRRAAGAHGTATAAARA